MGFFAIFLVTIDLHEGLGSVSQVRVTNSTTRGRSFILEHKKSSSIRSRCSKMAHLPTICRYCSAWTLSPKMFFSAIDLHQGSGLITQELIANPTTHPYHFISICIYLGSIASSCSKRTSLAISGRYDYPKIPQISSSTLTRPQKTTKRGKAHQEVTQTFDQALMSYIWCIVIQLRQFNCETCLNSREIDDSPPSKSQIAATSTSGSGNRHMVHVEHQKKPRKPLTKRSHLAVGIQTRNESNFITGSDSLSAKSVPGPPSDLGVRNALLVRWQVLLSRNKRDNTHRVRLDSHLVNKHLVICSKSIGIYVSHLIA